MWISGGPAEEKPAEDPRKLAIAEFRQLWSLWLSGLVR